MKSLYRILVLHGAPKDSHTSTETYLIAKDDEAVAKWINKEHCYGDWFGDEEEAKTRWSEGKEAEIPFRDWVLENKGDMSDDAGWEDAYYGVTKWGWEKVANARPEDFAVLKRLKIAKEAK